MNDLRTQELMNGMEAFSKSGYQKSEMLDEMLKLQREIAQLAVGSASSEVDNMRIYEVVRYLKEQNEMLGNVADNEIMEFENGSKTFDNLIKAEISGNRGEEKVFTALKELHSRNIVLKNIELENGNMRNELDAIVITPKCITIIEVKNTAKNIYIDEKGNYFRTGKYLRVDCNIATKMGVKEKLLRDAIAGFSNPNVKIQKLIVFTNNQIEVHNKRFDLRTCFIEQVTHYIDAYKGSEVFNDVDMGYIRDKINSADHKERYPLRFDVERYKKSFAAVMVALENAAAIKRETLIDADDKNESNGKIGFLNRIKMLFSHDYRKYVKRSASIVALTVMLRNVVENIAKR